MSITPSPDDKPATIENNRQHRQETGATHLTLVQETTDALMILDRDGIVRFADPGAEKLFGGGPSLVGKPAPLALQPGTQVLTLETEAEQRFVEVRLADSDWQGMPAYVASASDITARRQIEDAIDRARTVVRQTGRDNEAFFSNLSHSLRTPLNDIIGFSELIKEERLGPLENDKYKTYVADIHASSLALLDLIDEALGLANGDRSPAQTDAAASMEDVLRLADNCRRGGDEPAFALHMADGVRGVKIAGDPDGLQHAFRLLFSDAARNGIAASPTTLSIDCSDGMLVLEFNNCWHGHSDADLANMLDGKSALGPDPFALNPTKQRFQKTAAAFAAIKRMVDLYGGAFAILGNGDNGVRLRIKLKIAS